MWFYRVNTVDWLVLVAIPEVASANRHHNVTNLGENVASV